MTGVASLPHNPVGASRLSGRTALENPTLLPPEEECMHRGRSYSLNTKRMQSLLSCSILTHAIPAGSGYQTLQHQIPRQHNIFTFQNKVDDF